jgi:hypothetical protein
MGRVAKSNIPAVALRWSVERASTEFKIAPGTLRKSLGQSGAEPDSGGCFSTEQLCQALFGSMHVEKLATQRELTKRYRLDNTIVEASVLNRAKIEQALAAIADAMVSRIRASQLNRQEQDDLLANLAGIPVMLEETARSQTKLRRDDKQCDSDGDEDEI